MPKASSFGQVRAGAIKSARAFRWSLEWVTKAKPATLNCAIKVRFSMACPVCDIEGGVYDVIVRHDQRCVVVDRALRYQAEDDVATRAGATIDQHRSPAEASIRCPPALLTQGRKRPKVLRGEVGSQHFPRAQGGCEPVGSAAVAPTIH